MIFKRSKQQPKVKAMEDATTYQQWTDAAAAYDQQMGHADWKRYERSRSYDYRTIRAQLDKMRKLRKRSDHQQLLFTLNEGIHGNMGGIGKPALYSRSKRGTKSLIHQYLDEVCESLLDLRQSQKISQAAKKEFFLRASHCNGRTALLLGGGGTMGYFHAGVVKALHEQDLLPTVISGSSIGALLAAVVCAHTNEDLSDRLQPENLLVKLPCVTKSKKRRDLFTSENRIDADGLVRYINKCVPDLTFNEAFELSGRKLNISISGLRPGQAPRLLNAITAPNIFIRSAVQASCSIYGIYPPVTLQAKDSQGLRIPYLPSQKWMDGSFLDDLPMKRLTRLYGVNHFIGSIVNPVFLLSGFTPDAAPSFMRSLMLSQARVLKHVSREALKLSQDYLRIKSPLLNMSMHLSYSLLSQDHTADLNISPKRRLGNPLKLLDALSLEEINGLVREGELCAWERMEMVRNCTATSRTLDSILRDMGLMDIDEEPALAKAS